MNKVPIGELIKEITEKRNMSKSELGRRLNMTSTNVHKIFKRNTIDTGLLEKISDVLEHDFFLYFIKDKSLLSSYSIKNQTSLFQEAEFYYSKELTNCKEKVNMLEKINILLEEKLKGFESEK